MGSSDLVSGHVDRDARTIKLYCCRQPARTVFDAGKHANTVNVDTGDVTAPNALHNEKRRRNPAPHEFLGAFAKRGNLYSVRDLRAELLSDTPVNSQFLSAHAIPEPGVVGTSYDIECKSIYN